MNEQLNKIINHRATIPAIVGLLAFGGGVGLGYILGRRKPSDRYEIPVMDIDLEMAKIEERMADKHGPIVIEEEVVTVDDNVTNFVQKKIKEEIVIPQIVEETDEKELVRQNVFEHDDDWNYDLEEKKRSTLSPYILHKDEFYEDEKGYTQTTLTYYAGDNIVADEEDSPLYNHETVTGPLLFGHGSGDPNVVYVRNDKRRAEYEILLDPGLFSKEVLGIEIEDNERVKDLKHSHSPRKFRPDE